MADAIPGVDLNEDTLEHHEQLIGIHLRRRKRHVLAATTTEKESTGVGEPSVLPIHLFPCLLNHLDELRVIDTNLLGIRLEHAEIVAVAINRRANSMLFE